MVDFELSDKLINYLIIIAIVITIIVFYNSNCNNKHYHHCKHRNRCMDHEHSNMQPMVEHAFLSNINNKILSNCDKTRISLERYYIPSLDNINDEHVITSMSHSNLYKFPHKQRNTNNIYDYMYNDKYTDDTPIYQVVENNAPTLSTCKPKYMGYLL